MCLWAIYIVPGSVYIFPPAEQADPSREYIIRSQAHECWNWDWGLIFLFWEFLFRIIGILSLQRRVASTKCYIFDSKIWWIIFTSVHSWKVGGGVDLVMQMGPDTGIKVVGPQFSTKAVQPVYIISLHVLLHIIASTPLLHTFINVYGTYVVHIYSS